MSERNYQYGRPWIGVVFPIFVMGLILYGVISSTGKDITAYLIIGFITASMCAWAVLGFAMMRRRIIINEERITYYEPFAKNLLGHKKMISSKWEEILEVKGYSAYLLGQDVIVKTVNGSFRITSDIQGYQDLMKEIRKNTPHLRQVPGSKLLHLVSKTELEQVRKRKLPLKIKIWVGVISAVIIWAYVVVARNWYDFFMISLAWFYVIYLVETKK